MFAELARGPEFRPSTHIKPRLSEHIRYTHTIADKAVSKGIRAAGVQKRGKLR